MDIPDHLRVGAGVVTNEGDAYLLPGKGGSRFSSAPEILKFSQNRWVEVSIYDRWAQAGSSSSWSSGNNIYIIGGSNSSGVPTDEVVRFDTDEFLYEEETKIPTGARTNASYYTTGTKGYIGYGIQHDPTFGYAQDILSYDFETKTWETISSPPINEEITSAHMTGNGDLIYLLFPEKDQNNFYAYSISTQEWMTMNDFPGRQRIGSTICATRDDVLFGMGYDSDDANEMLDDIWKYNFEMNTWELFTNYPGVPYSNGFSFEYGDNVIFGGGSTEVQISENSLNSEIYLLRLVE